MRIALLYHYFHPEIGAPSARLHSLARNFRSLGHEVVVVTGFPNHPTGVIPPVYRGRLTAKEDIDGVVVLRNWIFATPNEGVVKKTLGHLSFMLTSVCLGGPRMGSVDVIVVSSPTFFSVISAWALSKLKGVPFVFEVRDLWPAVFVDLGIIKNRLVIRMLEALEMFLYRRSAAVVTVTESFRKDILSRGIPSSKVVTITNGVDLKDFSPGRPDHALETLLGVGGRFVILYLGAHGISHALEAILRSAQALQEQRDLLFVFVGEGAEKRKLVDCAKKWGLENVRFLDGQPRDRALDFYRLADIALVPLRDVPLFDGFIPSKMFEIMACAKPIVASLRGEAADILTSSKAAVVVSPEDSRAIAGAILELKNDRPRMEKMGEAGRSFVKKHYQRRMLAERYSKLLESIVARK